MREGSDPMREGSDPMREGVVPGLRPLQVENQPVRRQSRHR